MVRLIDADELKSVFTEKSTEAVCGAELCKAIISRIDDAPTVEAIPVKWLEDRIRLYRDCGNDLRANVIENEIELWRAKNRRGE